MNKHEFIMQFVLNRCMAGNVATDSLFWIEEALKAWDKINECALSASMEYELYLQKNNTASGGENNS